MKLYSLILFLLLSIAMPSHAEDPNAPATPPPADAPAAPPTMPEAAQPGQPAAADAPAPASVSPEGTPPAPDAAATAPPPVGAEGTSPPPPTPPAEGATPAAENPAPPTESAPAAEGTEVKEKEKEKENENEPQINEAERAQRKTGIARLMKKLTDKDGKPVPIAVLTPLDYTTLDFAAVATETIINTISRYGQFDLRSINYTPASLTLEEFRKVVTKYRTDIVILSVLKPTNFDMFLYDRRNPYAIYAHSETLPEELQYQLTKPVVEEYSKVIVRRTLYAYMQDQFYELPREEIHPLLSAEIPRWIASARTLSLVNRDLIANYYGSVSVGAALTTDGSHIWNSNLVALQLGRRIGGSIFGELALNMFAYNAAIASLKYVISGKDTPFRVSFGGGLATTINSHTINWDQYHTQGLGAKYIVPSFSFSFPVVEVHFKLETQLFVGLGGGHYIFSILPGLLINF